MVYDYRSLLLLAILLDLPPSDSLAPGPRRLDIFAGLLVMMPTHGSVVFGIRGRAGILPIASSHLRSWYSTHTTYPPDLCLMMSELQLFIMTTLIYRAIKASLPQLPLQ